MDIWHPRPRLRSAKISRSDKRFACRGSPVGASGSLYEIAAAGDFLDTLFISGVSLSIAVNVGISALPLLVGIRDAEKLKQAVEDDDQDIKWGVMSLLSFFPLLNWLVRALTLFAVRLKQVLRCHSEASVEPRSILQHPKQTTDERLYTCRLGCLVLSMMRSAPRSTTPTQSCTCCHGSAGDLSWTASRLPAWWQASFMFRYLPRLGLLQSMFVQLLAEDTVQKKGLNSRGAGCQGKGSNGGK